MRLSITPLTSTPLNAIFSSKHQSLCQVNHIKNKIYPCPITYLKPNMEKYTYLDRRLYIFVMSVVALIVTVSMIAENNMQLQRVLITYPIDEHNKILTTRLCARHGDVLYGVFSTVDKMQVRNVLRQQVQCNLNSIRHHTIFVIGKPRTQNEHDIIHEEQRLHGDIFILSCEENMNEGKTYTYFKEAMQMFPCFNFYAKVDDDTAFAPDKLSAKIRSVPNDTPLIIGRTLSSDDLWLLSLKWIYYGFRDLSWTIRENYTAGLLYVLNTQAIREWIHLNPSSTQLYGDEDVRTSYYMDLIGAKVINLDVAIHDYIGATIYNQLTTWKTEITNTSLAVHKCKTPQLLSNAFASICA